MVSLLLEIFTIRESGVANQLIIAKTTGAATFTNLAGTGSRIVVADANGLLSASAALSGYVTGSGTTNRIPKFTGANSIGDSLITDNGTTVNVALPLTTTSRIATGNVGDKPMLQYLLEAQLHQGLLSM